MTEAGRGARLVDESNLVGELTALKAEPGKNLLLMGGSSLAAELSAHGPIDERQVVVHPVVSAAASRSLPRPRSGSTCSSWSSRTFDSRTVLLRHRPDSR